MNNKLEAYEASNIRHPILKKNSKIKQVMVDKASIWDSMDELVKQAKEVAEKATQFDFKKRNEKIKRVEKMCISFNDGDNKRLMYEQKTSGKRKNVLETLDFPFDTDQVKPENIQVVLQDVDGNLELIEDFDYIKYLLLANGKDYEDNDSIEYENKTKLSPVLSSLPLGKAGSTENYFTYPESYDFPSLKYQDVTERDMFGYDVISANNLASEEKGIWGFHGFRKWEIEISRIPAFDASDLDLAVGFFWYEIDNVQLKEPIFVSDDCVYFDRVGSGETAKFVVYIDTNKLGAAIHKHNIESTHPTFRGRFEVHMNYTKETKTYAFPIKLCITDTMIDENGNTKYKKLMSGDIVSIDFGTSSTCAAVKCGVGAQLFTLSGKEKYTSSRKNPYENPTNLMLYDWPEVYYQWEAGNANCPFFIGKTNDLPELMVDYDSGYTVEEEYKHADEENGMRKVRAIISQLKMLPYYMSKGEERKITPYNSDSNIYVVNDIELEDGQHFNPIAFYGYLLARAINNPAEGKIYRNYQITYPAKFNRELREQIRKSIEYGIKRALPLPVRYNEKRPVSVSMTYSEPEACVGAVLGKQFHQHSDEARLFSVYDLGGGTMDFAFGVLRNVDDNNEDEADVYDAMVTLTGIDGVETVGGEKLIHELAYKIYLENKEEIESKGIKFVLPEEAKYPQGFEGLLSNRREEVSEANTNTLMELIARPLFEYNGEFNSVDDIDEALLGDSRQKESAVTGDLGSGLEDSFGLSDIEDGLQLDKQIVKSDVGKVRKAGSAAQTYTITLQVENQYDKNIEVNLKITPDTVKGFLVHEIENTIKQFKTLMQHYFTKPEAIKHLKKFYNLEKFSTKDVTIFLGGNASKQYYVEKLMRSEKYFGPKQVIQRIGYGQNNESLSHAYWLNEKTAVAMGQLNFGGEFGVDKTLIGEDKPAFLFTVGYRDKNGKFSTVIEKGCVDHSWHRANRINKFNKTVDLLYSTSATNDMSLMKHLNDEVEDFFEEGKYILYLRVNCEYKLEYRLGTSKDVLDDHEDINEHMMLEFVE